MSGNLARFPLYGMLSNSLYT
uniref:Uncharacterized protein n=1 Tax=Anguilla anguilla TaxID=7936 RepID=A0A0E9WGU5_ANGAN